MEEWEEAHIKSNLDSLVKLTFCHVDLLSVLEARRVLSGEEVQQIMAKHTDREKAKLLYGILPSRKNAYEILTAALLETRQSGASSILEKTPIDKIANLRIQFLGKVCQVKELLSSVEIKQVHKYVQKNASPEECAEMEENIFKSETPVQLVRDTMPAPDPLYIPRFLCQRLDINPGVFKTECSDVFVFKNVERFELRKFIGDFNIESSEEILKRKKTDCRFILLRTEHHWHALCAKIAFPRHVIRYESAEKGFVLEASTGDSKALSDYLQRGNCQNISEVEFIRKAVEENIGSVCICDLPGMGKSLLLASMARQVSEENRENVIVAFIQLSQLDTQPQSDCDTILEYISTSVLAKFLLCALIKTHPVNWFLFFDGLDEVRNEDLERTTEFLRNMRNTFPTAKVIVTSRPVVRQQLEKACRAISFDILPFNAITQVHFLTSVWRQLYPAQDSTRFEEYARICLEKLEALGPKEKEIAGVPLQCKMIAEVFADEASYYADSKQLFVKEAGCSFETTLLEIYRLYLQRQLDRSTCSYKCMEQGESTCGASCRVRSFHVWQAIQLLFPNSAEKVVNRVNTFEDLSVKEKFSPALLLQASIKGSKQTPEFSHRTFAEYLVAEYLFENASIIPKPLLGTKGEPKMRPLLLQEFVLVREAVVAYFLNAFMAQARTQETSLSLEICSASSSLTRTNLLRAILQCAVHDFGCLLISLTIARTRGRADRLLRIAQLDFWKPQCETLYSILAMAVEMSSVSTIRTLVRYYELQYTSGVLKEIFVRHPERVLNLCSRGDYELALLFADTLVSLTTVNLLTPCLKHTCDQSDELVEKRIEIAKLFLSKRGSLITEPWKDDDGPLFILNLHPKCFQFLIENGADIRQNRYGRSFLESTSDSMSQAGTCHVFRSIFIGRPIEDLLFLLSGHFLEFRFPFRRVRIVLRVLNLISRKALDRSREQFELIWQAGVEPFENASTQAELLEVLRHPHVLGEDQQGCHKLFVMAVEDGDVEVGDALLNHDSTLLEKRLEYWDRTPVLVAVEKKQMVMFEKLVSRGANILPLGCDGYTVLHAATCYRTQDCRMFHRVVELLVVFLDATESGNANAENILKVFNDVTEDEKQTPLHHACRYIKNLRVETLELFLSSGTPETGPFFTSINAVDSDGETALTLALKRCRSLELVKVLVQHGASWSHKTTNGSTVAHICAKEGLFEHLKYFVELGIDVNALDMEGNNALQVAILHWYASKDEPMCLFLIDAGVNKWHKNKKGRTAFDLLVPGGWQSEEILKHLKPQRGEVE